MGKTRDLFKKIRDTKRTFHAKMGSIKDRNGMDLTEAEDIKKRLFLGSLVCSIDLMSVFVPIPCYFDNCSFLVLSKVWKGNTSNFILFLQVCFGNSGSFLVPYKFQNYSSSVKNIIDNLIGISLNLQIVLGSMII